MCPQGGMEVLPKLGDKLGSSVENDCLGHTMQTHDTSKVQLDILLSHVVDVHRNEMSRLSESIHNPPYGIILVAERGTLTMKFMLMSSHFETVIFRGCSNPAGLS
jgi:hypothetical protein